MASWQFILTDLYGTNLGEITQASSRKIVLPHLRVPSASFTVPIWSDMAAYLMNTDTLLQCFRYDYVTNTKTLAFNGPVVSAEEAGDGTNETIAVTAAGPFWRLTKRLIPTSTQTTLASYGTAGAPIDLGYIAQQLILPEVNGNPADGKSFTGIDGNPANGAQYTASKNGWIAGWQLKPVAEAIAELSAQINSFEFRVRPTLPTAYANSPANWPRIGLLDVAPTIGSNRPNAIFEYGTPRANVAAYSRSVSRDSLLTRGVMSVSGWPDSIDSTTAIPPVAKYSLRAREAAGEVLSRGRFEESLSDAGVLDDSLRDGMIDFHLNYRKNPREIVTFQPAQNSRPTPLVDYDVGDTVRARAVVGGSLRFDAAFRIWGATFNVDENGNENVELELVMP